MSELVNAQALIDWSDVKQRNKLIKWLQENHIAYRLNRDGKPITTQKAINDSLKSVDDEEIDF